MVRVIVASYFAGVVTGAGLALFFMYILSDAVTITMVGWPRIAIGGVGIALWMVGGLWQRKLSSNNPASAV